MDSSSASGVLSLSSYQLTANLDAVERSRIVVQDLFLYRFADGVIFLKDFYGVDFARSVGMAVIRTDDDIVFAGILEHVGKIVVGLRGDVNLEFLAWVFREPLGAGAPDGFIHHPGHPLGGRFDECQRSPGNSFGTSLIINERQVMTVGILNCANPPILSYRGLN